MDARLDSLIDRVISLERQLDALRAENATLREVHAAKGPAKHLAESDAAAA